MSKVLTFRSHLFQLQYRDALWHQQPEIVTDCQHGGGELHEIHVLCSFSRFNRFSTKKVHHDNNMVNTNLADIKMLSLGYFLFSYRKTMI